LKDRISLDFTYYNRESRGQIISPRTSYGSGSVIRIMNGGSVVNHGIEVQLKGSPIRKKDLDWNMTFNFTLNRGIVNTLLKIFLNTIILIHGLQTVQEQVLAQVKVPTRLVDG
jgi:hypothetical protein